MADTSISGLPAKDTPVAADVTNILDSAASNADKKITLGNIPLTGNIELKALATGILKNTTTTGTPSIAVADTDYVAPANSKFASLTATAGGVAQYDVCYILAAGTVGKAKADAAATMYVCGIAAAAIAAGNAGNIQISGVITNAGWSWTPGLPVFVSKDTAGALTQTAPSATGEQVQMVGIAAAVTSIQIAIGDLIEVGPTNADTVTAANEAADTSCFPLFVTAATGDLGPKTNAGLSFNSSTGMLTATGLTGPLTGNADTASNLSGTPALPDGTTATTQGVGDDSTKLATTAFVLANAGTSTVGSSSIVGPFFNGGPDGLANWLLRSDEFDAVNWTKSAGVTVTANSGSYRDPQGNTKSDLLNTASGATDNVLQNITDSTTGDWTFSVWLRATTGTYTAQIVVSSTDVSDVVVEAGTPETVTLTTEWVRYSVTQTFSTAHAKMQAKIVIGTNSVLAWGAQLRPLSWAGPYYRTAGSAQTSPLYRYQSQGSGGASDIELYATNMNFSILGLTVGSSISLGTNKITATTTNGCAGTFALDADTETVVSNTKIGANSLVFISPTTTAAAALHAAVTAVTASTSFTVTHSSAAGGETFNYFFVN